jgi:bifunctional DNA-binding transcriptional regulator/antitoxin component of YhaV-PrlF toxin-antitoxin module
MRNSNIVRLDSKGRILIPIHIRNTLKADEGTEVVIIPDKNNSHMKVLPLVNGKTAEIRLLLNDLPGSLASIANMLSEHDIDIIMSESRTLAKGKLAEWNVIVDTSNFNNGFEGLKQRLLNSELVKNVEVVRK